MTATLIALGLLAAGLAYGLAPAWRELRARRLKRPREVTLTGDDVRARREREQRELASSHH